MIQEQRLALQQRLFPAGIPKLWCPTLTHFSAARTLDSDRICQHLETLAPLVRGILVPGSTGEGWQMSDGEIRRLLDVVLPAAQRLQVHVLIGILKTDPDQVHAAIDQLQDYLSSGAATGITVCPAKGEQLTQSELVAGLSSVLDRGIPTALYQLPQVTQNELSPASVTELADRYANFVLFKDTSGLDRVATSGVDLKGVFLVRGSEKNGYAQWLRGVGGPYDGFLLSTANVFASQLSEVIRACEQSSAANARAISDQLQGVVSAAFAAASRFPSGNAFTNANKAVYHVQRWGPQWRAHDRPCLIDGTLLPDWLLAEVASALGIESLPA